MSELRWHPLRREWVMTATHRMERTFLPPPSECPLCPSGEGKQTEIPREDFDIVVFENRFPSLFPKPPSPSVSSSQLYKVKPSRGVCEVVVYTPEHTGSLATQSLERIYKLFLVWQDRFRELSKLPYVRYVYVFENKGKEVGVTLHHPHGQIYAFPFIPPVIHDEIRSLREHKRKEGRCLICDIAEREKEENRVIIESSFHIAFVPFFARWPYEVFLMPKLHIPSLDEYDEEKLFDLAQILKAVLLKYDNLFSFPLPYMMVMHQRPSKDKSGLFHYHIEFYPPYRSKDKLKYLASVESGAGNFINDSHPEDKAKELRELPPFSIEEVE
ncbi:galactose-1-phosphate uridylyltransferase [bacterium]|nr:galactose-1-phosphate uridylyltransferase [bacterium]